MARQNPPSGTVVLDKNGKEVLFCCPSHKVRYMKQNPEAKEVQVENKFSPSPVILVDLDETLIHTIPWYRGNPLPQLEQQVRELKHMRDYETADELEKFVTLMRSAPTIALDGLDYTITLRPSAKAFLREANKVGTVALFTAAHRDYAEAALKATGLRKYIGSVYTTRDLPNPYELVQGRPWVLVDDLYNIEKVRRMGNPPNGRIVQIDSFDEGDATSPLPDPNKFFPKA